MRVRSAAFFFLLLFGLSAHACSCAIAGGQCGALKPSGTLFLGEVTAERSVRVPMHFPGRNDLFTQNRVFHIHVLEVFSGAQHVGEDVDVSTGSGGGDCGYGFIVGRRYLVDAYSSQPDTEAAGLRGVGLSTGICSQTREEGDATIMLRELRTALARGRQPDLHGSVRYVNEWYTVPSEPMPSLMVTVTAARDGAAYSSQTDADGIYTFSTLPAGEYSVSLNMPPHRRLIDHGDRQAVRIAIPTNDGAGLACHLDVQVGPTGGLHLRVVDATGKMQPGNITVHPAGSPQISGSYGGELSEGGDFTLAGMPDGIYELTFDNSETHKHGEATATVRNGVVSDAEDIIATPFFSHP